MGPTPDEDRPAEHPTANDNPDPEPLPREACAWCGRVLREGPEPTSHGICPECLARLQDSLNRPKP